MIPAATQHGYGSDAPFSQRPASVRGCAIPRGLHVYFAPVVGGDCGGGTFVSDLTDDSESHSLAISSREDAAKEEKEEKEVMSVETEDREAREEMCIETDGSGAKESDAKEEEIRSLARWWSTVTKQKFGVCDTANVIDDLVLPMEGTDLSMMTAETPDTALPPPPISYHFEFDVDFAGGNEGVLDDDTIPDDDTAPCDASAETRWMRGWRGQDEIVEGKGSSPGPRINPGPPYALGDVIMCDTPGASRGLQRAFVLWADHPNY